MEVYEVICEKAEYGSYDLDIDLFDSYEKAKNAFDKIVAYEKKSNDIMNSEALEINEEDDYFDIWESDRGYSENHCYVRIDKGKVN